MDPRNIHAYVFGEHGETEFVPWSQAMLATKPILELCRESGGHFCQDEMEKIGIEVKDAAQKIIQAKKATYYGIGMSLVRITKAILGNENSVLTLSVMLNGEYNQHDVYAGVPCIVNRSGIAGILPLSLTDEEQQKLQRSCDTLRELYHELNLSGDNLQ